MDIQHRNNVSLLSLGFLSRKLQWLIKEKAPRKKGKGNTLKFIFQGELKAYIRSAKVIE